MLTVTMSAHDEMPRQSIKERLALLRARAGMSPADLAKASGVSKATVSRLEAGEQKSLKVPTARRLATALGCDPRELDEWGPLVTPLGVAEEPAAYAISATVAHLPTIEDEEWEWADWDRLFLAYVSSDWFMADQPTPEEMRALKDYPGFQYPKGGPRPTAGTVHSLLERMRGRKQ